MVPKRFNLIKSFQVQLLFLPCSDCSDYSTFLQGKNVSCILIIINHYGVVLSMHGWNESHPLNGMEVFTAQEPRHIATKTALPCRIYQGRLIHFGMGGPCIAKDTKVMRSRMLYIYIYVWYIYICVCVFWRCYIYIYTLFTYTHMGSSCHLHDASD